MVAFFAYIIIINVVSFHLYRIDKLRAEREEYRISETTLLSVSYFGGALGAYCAMREYRHKTLHTAFTVGVPVALVLWTILVIWAMAHCLVAL